jgi:hypothetical protein
MTKKSIDLQDLRRRIYVKAKANEFHAHVEMKQYTQEGEAPNGGCSENTDAIIKNPNDYAPIPRSNSVPLSAGSFEYAKYTSEM